MLATARPSCFSILLHFLPVQFCSYRTFHSLIFSPPPSACGGGGGDSVTYVSWQAGTWNLDVYVCDESRDGCHVTSRRSFHLDKIHPGQVADDVRKNPLCGSSKQVSKSIDRELRLNDARDTKFGRLRYQPVISLNKKVSTPSVINCVSNVRGKRFRLLFDASPCWATRYNVISPHFW